MQFSAATSSRTCPCWRLGQHAMHCQETAAMKKAFAVIQEQARHKAQNTDGAFRFTFEPCWCKTADGAVWLWGGSAALTKLRLKVHSHRGHIGLKYMHAHSTIMHFEWKLPSNVHMLEDDCTQKHLGAVKKGSYMLCYLLFGLFLRGTGDLLSGLDALAVEFHDRKCF